MTVNHTTLSQLVRLQRSLSEADGREETLRQRAETYRALFMDAPVGIGLADQTGKIIDTNTAMQELFGYSPKEFKHLSLGDLDAEMTDSQQQIAVLKAQGNIREWERTLRRKNGSTFPALINVNRITVGDKIRFFAGIRDITKPKHMEEALRRAHDELDSRVQERTAALINANDSLRLEIHQRSLAEQKLKDREKDLETKTVNLEEVNTALKVLLKRREEDKNEMEEKITSNVKEMIDPLLTKLHASGLDERQEAFVEIISSSLHNLISSFSPRLLSTYYTLTPTEIQVANMVREGKTTKDIAQLMGLSPGTIETHRKNIRNKLAIKKKKTNLRSYLLALGSR